MLFRKRKKKPEKLNPNVVTVRWILFAFFMLALAGNYRKMHSVLPAKSLAEIEKSIEKAAPPIPIDFRNIINMLPADAPAMNIKDLQDGKGEPAVCGQRASVAYTDASDENEKNLTFRIGEHKVLAALELGVVGMKKGGRRMIVASGGEKDAKGAFNVRLVDISPSLPDSKTSAFRVSNGRSGGGRLILCGQKVKVRLAVWSVEGKKLFPLSEDDKAPIVFTIGKSEVFLGLEQGIIGMNIGSKYSLVVPPEFQKTMDGNEPKVQFPFPPKQTVLVDVEAMP